MVGSMRTFGTDRQTDRQTDGAGYIGPADGKGGSNKQARSGPARVEKMNLDTKIIWRQV